MKVDREKDGKQELDYGKEELEKDPKSKKKKKKLEKEEVKKSFLQYKWDLLKATISHDNAFMNMAAEDGLAEAEQEEEGEEELTNQVDEGESNDPNASPDDGSHPDLAISGADMEDEQTDAEAEEGAENGSDEEQDQGDGEVMQQLVTEGYSEAEIGHIMHGHSFPEVDPSGEIKRDDADHDRGLKDKMHGLDYDHKKRMSDLEYEKVSGEDNGSEDKQMERKHTQRMNDLEYQKATQDDYDNQDKEVGRDHKKRMSDLEYEKAKSAHEIELAYKEKEHEAKLRLLEHSHSHKIKMAEEKAKHSMQEQKDTLKQRSVDKKAEAKEGNK